jgi:hypothetical protein
MGSLQYHNKMMNMSVEKSFEKYFHAKTNISKCKCHEVENFFHEEIVKRTII